MPDRKMWARTWPAAAAAIAVLGLFGWLLQPAGKTERPAEPAGETGATAEFRPVKIMVALGLETGFSEYTVLADRSGGTASRVRQVLERFSQIPSAVRDRAGWPFDPKPRSVFLEKNGFLVIDLEKPLAYNQACGANGEWRLMRSLLRTMKVNFTEVKRLKVLLNGNESDTLAGHVDISEPWPVE